MKFLKFKGFTLAEALITLVVVGVVSAMTLPVLINKINDMQYDRAREKALKSIGEAGRIIAVSGNINSAENAEDFVKNVLSKNLKIIKTCDTQNLKNCGISPKVTVKDKEYNMITSISDSTNYGFVTADGFAVNLFYNPNCDANAQSTANICMGAIYDMNGLKKPNRVGKDIGFVGVLYPNEKSMALAVSIADVFTNGTISEAIAICKENNAKLPSVYELDLMRYFKPLSSYSKGDFIWSSTFIRTGYMNRGLYYMIQFSYAGGTWGESLDWNNRGVICIK